MISARFTHFDHLQPTYCRSCHARIPRALKETNGGVCARCTFSGKGEARQILDRHRELQLAKKEAIRSYSTGLGKCPHCSQRNISEIPKMAPNPLGRWLGWSGASCLLAAIGGFAAFGQDILVIAASFAATGIILLVTGSVQTPTRQVGRIQVCNNCALHWNIEPKRAA